MFRVGIQGPDRDRPLWDEDQQKSYRSFARTKPLLLNFIFSDIFVDPETCTDLLLVYNNLYKFSMACEDFDKDLDPFYEIIPELNSRVSG